MDRSIIILIVIINNIYNFFFFSFFVLNQNNWEILCMCVCVKSILNFIILPFKFLYCWFWVIVIWNCLCLINLLLIHRPIWMQKVKKKEFFCWNDFQFFIPIISFKIIQLFTSILLKFSLNQWLLSKNIFYSLLISIKFWRYFWELI